MKTKSQLNLLSQISLFTEYRNLGQNGNLCFRLLQHQEEHSRPARLDTAKCWMDGATDGTANRADYGAPGTCNHYVFIHP